MGLFGQKPTTTKKPKAALTASGARINLTKRTTGAKNIKQKSWQTKAWEYRDTIGEIRFATQFLSNAVSKVRFFVAEVKPDQDIPTPLPAKDPADSALTSAQALEAQAELERLPLTSGYSFLGVLTENLGIAGEAYLHGYEDENGEEQWEILSTEQIKDTGTGEIQFKDPLSGQYRPLKRDNNGNAAEELIRLWRPHPKERHLADAPLISLGIICETLILAEAETQASTQSRIASNGLLAVPEGFSLPKGNSTDDDNNDSFLDDLTEALIAPINDPGLASAAVPVVIKGNAEDISAIKHFRFDREDINGTNDKAERALRTLARSLDVPPEIITGLGDSNHWSAWQINTSTYQHHIDPMVRLIADSLTMGYLRPALKALGWSPEDLAKVQIWHDPGQLTENPNRSQDAKDAFDRGGISFATLRDMLGFSEDDAPTPEELRQILAIKSGLSPDLAAAILNLASSANSAPITINGQTKPEPKQIETAPLQPSPTTSDEATPATQPETPLVAAAPPVPEWKVDTELGKELADIDRELRDRILTLMDATFEATLSKAGNQLRTHANRTTATRATYKNELSEMTGVQMLTFIGREKALQLGLNEDNLITEALNLMKPKIVQWTQAAIRKAVALLLRATGIKAGTPAAEAIEEKFNNPQAAQRAWSTLSETLSRYMQNRMYNPSPKTTNVHNENIDHTTPSAPITEYINTIGGNKPGADIKGLATGTITNETLTSHGHHNIGFQWRYGPTPPPDSFPPHLKLAGKRFTGFDDPRLIPPPTDAWIGPVFHPGDHEGCLCDYMPIYAIQQANETLAERLGRDSEGMAGDRLLADLDNRAGRKGTSAQRSAATREEILKLQSKYILG